MAETGGGRRRPRKAQRVETEDQRQRRLEYKRRYRLEHAEEIAAYKRGWRERNLDHDRARNREYMRAKKAEPRLAEEKRREKADYARARYHADVEASRARARELNARRRESDPDRYREDHRRHNQTWRDRHRDEINARLRERNRLDPSKKTAVAQRFYVRHADEIRAARRFRYQENRERELARQRLWRQREKRRRELGLPAQRLHRLPVAERRENVAAANAFFARPITPELRKRVEADLRTPPELLGALHREFERIRADQYALRHPEIASSIPNRGTAEEERMDAIARVINDRLRTTPRRPPPATAYLPVQSIDRGGLEL